MSLEIRKSSHWWYGVFKVDGRKSVINLGVAITGRRPPKRTMLGDDEFERSRGRAEEAYRALRRRMREDRNGTRSLQKLAEMKSGQRVSFPKLAELPALWEAIPRRKAPDPVYARQCKLRLATFADFVVRAQRGVRDFVEVKPETAKAFMAAEQERGVAPKTWNDILKLLRATFKHLHPHLNDGSNPFHGLVTKATETVNREPFTVEEMKAILEACADDDFIRPLIVTGMCTAMRRGDCCLLKWEDVDHKEGFLTVKTAKTGETVDIPMFPMLRDELAKARAKAGESKFCFPEAAEMYQNNPDGITWRVKQVLGRAFERLAITEGRALSQVPPEEARARGLAYIDGLSGTAKAARMRQVFTAYMDGQGINEVMASTGASRGSVSGHLNEIERAIGCSIVRGRRVAPKSDTLQVEREHGQRRASVRDFHSFRVTWITLALAAGVPLELVQRVTGHRTVAVVMKHYFRPGREDFRQTILKAMPKLLAEGTPRSINDQVLAVLERMTAKTWRPCRAEAIRLLAQQ